MILKLHRACKVIGFTQKEMPNEWPQAFSLEHIAKLQFPENASDESVFFHALKVACTGGSLKHIATIELRQYKLSASVQHHITERARHELRDNSYEVTVHYVDYRDLAAWLEKQGEEPSAHLAAWFKAALSDAPTPSKGAVGASGGVEPDKAGPLPLTTNEIANCFSDFREWDVKRWKRELGSPDNWLKACQHSKGTRGKGGHESTWWPVQIAVALVNQDSKSARHLRARFKRIEQLSPWLDELEINIPDNSDSQ